MPHRTALIVLVTAATLSHFMANEPLPAQQLGTHGFVDSTGVKIHYVTMGDTRMLRMTSR